MYWKEHLTKEDIRTLLNAIEIAEEHNEDFEIDGDLIQRLEEGLEKLENAEE